MLKKNKYLDLAKAKREFVVKEYALETFHRSNQDTCLLHNPAVFEGDWVQTGDLLADCAASAGGELSLGKNILVAYMPWEGYNYEDAILISERLVYEDVYSSIHIERYDVEIRETKFGIETITRNIPELNEHELKHLDSNGVAKVGSWIKEGDILVGRITPINKKAQSTYQNLLYTILDKSFSGLSPSGEAVGALRGTDFESVRDSSLRAPKGIKAKVVNIQIYKFREQNSKLLSQNRKMEKKIRRPIKQDKRTKSNFMFTKTFNFLKAPEAPPPGYAFFSLPPRAKPGISLKLLYKNFQKIGACKSIKKIQANSTPGAPSTGAPSPPHPPRGVGGTPFGPLWGQRGRVRGPYPTPCPNPLLPPFAPFCPQKGAKGGKRGRGPYRKPFLLGPLERSGAFFWGRGPKKKSFFLGQGPQKKELFFGAPAPKKSKGLWTRGLGAPARPPFAPFWGQKGVWGRPKGEGKGPLQKPQGCAFGALTPLPHACFFLGPQKKAEHNALKGGVFTHPPGWVKGGAWRKATTGAISLKLHYKNFKIIGKAVPGVGAPKAGKSATYTGLKKNKENQINRVYVYLAEKRKIQVGDKMAGRHGNKGIVSLILPRQDMPFLANGLPIDMVLNPLGVPSRMNVGQIYECLLGLAAKYLGEHYKIFPFDEIYGPEASRSFVYSKLYEARKKTGHEWLFDPNSPGKTRLFDGRSGEPFDQSVTVGYAYMLKLVHLVDDKIHCLTPDHDVLTSDGWVKIEEVGFHHEVATLTKTGQLVYQYPSNVFHYKNYKGSLYHIKNSNVDLFVTLNHRMYVKNGRCSKAQYKLVEAKDLIGKHYKYLKNANWISNVKHEFLLPAVLSNSVIIPARQLNMDAWLFFFGLWMAEGWSGNNTVLTRLLFFGAPKKSRVGSKAIPQYLGVIYPSSEASLPILDVFQALPLSPRAYCEPAPLGWGRGPKSTMRSIPPPGLLARGLGAPAPPFANPLLPPKGGKRGQGALNPGPKARGGGQKGFHPPPEGGGEGKGPLQKPQGATEEPEYSSSLLSQQEVSKPVYQVQICQQKQHVLSILKNAVTQLGYSYRVIDNKLTIFNKQLWSYLQSLVGSPNKLLPSWVWLLNQRQAQILLSAMCLADGTFQGQSVYYYTSSVKLADDVMRLALHAGWSGNKHLYHPVGNGSPDILDDQLLIAKYPLWRVSIIKSQNNPAVNHSHPKEQKNQVEEVLPYEGSVYCLSVPNEVFYVRRNGIPVWTGNSRSTGPYSLVTQQPLRGRSKQGGQRLGEMEVWALEGYGAAFTLLEMLTIKSDDMTGRMTLWSNLILNKDIAIGTPESFKVLVCELQALCLDIGIFRVDSAGKLAEIESLTQLP